MDDIVTSMHISLGKAHVEGIPEYIKNLQAISDRLEDFHLEGKAALMFATVGCSVTIRERAEPPDLALKFNNEQFYAEVKHFRKKEQDRIDAARMSDPNCCVDEFGPYLVPYGDTVPLEGKCAWQQVYDVAKNKIKQYREHAANVLVIESSSTSIEESEIATAINMINGDIGHGKCLGLARLNGILLALDWYNISQQWRKVFFYPTSNPAVSLSRELSALLGNICLG